MWFKHVTLLLHVVLMLLGSVVLNGMRLGDFNKMVEIVDAQSMGGLPREYSNSALDPDKDITPETLQKILAGVERGNKENIYYFGVLKLYGLSVGKNITQAASNFERAANLGHVEAMTVYALMLMNGAGVEVDYHAAIRYLREAVAKKDMNAHWLLGRMLSEGKGIPAPAHEEALVYLEIASKNNVVQANFNLGVMYEYGLGVTANFDKAAEYYRIGAENDHWESAYHLALMYAYARGVQQDFKRALSLFERAARARHAPSHYYMGVFRLYGYGCMIDYEIALGWFERAAAFDDPRISETARKAADELRNLIDVANKKNEEVINAYVKMGEGG